MKDKKFYITTTLPYVNAAPHIGFALEIIEADIIARYQEKILGNEVIFNTGTDEHGQKIWQKATEQNKQAKEYCDEWASKFEELKNLLNLSFNHFIRTTDEKHIKAAQEFWRLCEQNGDIYKAKYEVKYCIGCEMAKTESELVENHCPLHPNQDLELREEENYFFRFSKYGEKLLALYEKNPNFVKPASRLNEIKAFVKTGLTDFSISRLKEKMPWGIEVPSDDQHVMYVWFDALVNYISTLDWPQNQENFSNFWPGIQIAGKDNLRQQSAMWQAMLLSANLENSARILINGFIGVNGQKMSKSLGNVISPSEMVARYGVDGTRYLLVNLGTFGEDSDVTFEKLDINYNANLANGIGNLCSRTAKMAEQIGLICEATNIEVPSDFKKLMDDFDLNEALSYIDGEVSNLDKFLATNTPWKKEGEEKKQILLTAAGKINQITIMLSSFMPETALKIQEHFMGKVKSFETGLFPRLI
jgi:methionyl-tRNA synthetase